MQCPYCKIAFHPQFIVHGAQYDMKSDMYNQVHSQYCPQCREFIIGVYKYKLSDYKILTTDTYQDNLVFYSPLPKT